ncbi:MAG: beta-lactamase family protein [Anaerolineaceae bacterium]|nr:beta-lactamase family protein [Anaerolineaceae bacterium]
MVKTIKRLAILLAILLILSVLIPMVIVNANQTLSQINIKEIDQFLEQQVDANRIPGMAIAIIQEDEILFMKGYGESSPGVPVTPQTQFYLGSISKSFTALAAMHLVEEGKLNLDMPVQHYLPWFKVADESASSKITVRHLLNHTSGLSSTKDPNVDVLTQTLKEQTEYMQYVQPVTEAGTQFEYYNQNYRIIGCLIEEISGQTYDTYLASHIFQPLNMPNTVTHPDQAIALSQGYTRFLGQPMAMPQEYNPGALPSGYIISTAEDMAQYLISHLNNIDAEGSLYLSPNLMADLHTPPQSIDSTYAMGWMKKEEAIAHGGSLNRFQTFMMLNTESKTGVILLFNQNSMQNMLTVNNDIRQGIENAFNGQPIQPRNFRWVGWMIFALIVLDMANHLRLYVKLSRWWKNPQITRKLWLWLKTIVGIVLPLFILLGLPQLIHQLDGGAPTWREPFGLMPDLTLWLIFGLSLTVIRNLLKMLRLIQLNR